MQNRPGAARQKFHGWKVLSLAAFSQMVSVGFTVYLIGLYIEPLARAFDATPGQLGWASSIFMLVASGLGPLLGYWVDRGEVKRLMSLGALLLGLGFIALSLCASLLQAALACIFLIGPGAALLGIVTAGAMLSQWFERRRGLALGIAAAGISIGGFAMPPLAAFLFESYDWRIASQLFGAFILLTLLPGCWFIAVAKPADMGQFPDGLEPPPGASAVQAASATDSFSGLLRRADFWLITAAVGSVSFSSISIITYLIPFSREQGIDLQLSAFMLSVYAGSAFFGKFVYGWLADKFAPARLLTSVAAVMILGLVPMLQLEQLALYIASISVLGLGVGGLMPVWASLVARNFGPQAFGRVKGAMSLVLTSVAVIPGPLGGYIHDWKGSYAMTFSVVLAVLTVGVLVSLLIPTRQAAQSINEVAHAQ